MTSIKLAERMYKSWCSKESLPLKSADELIAQCYLTSDQRKWVDAFIIFWDTIQEI